MAVVHEADHASLDGREDTLSLGLYWWSWASAASLQRSSGSSPMPGLCGCSLDQSHNDFCCLAYIWHSAIHPFVQGYYFTGDGAKRDKEGYYWITGRVDDVINVSGHRVGTAEVEGALEGHEACAEAAVIG